MTDDTGNPWIIFRSDKKPVFGSATESLWIEFLY